MTPAALLPIGLTSFSLNLIAFPPEVTSIIWSSPEVGMTQPSSSPALNLIASIPFFLTASSESISTFFIIPLVVAIKRNILFCPFGMGTTAVMTSVGATWRKFTMALPFDWRDDSGTSYALVWKTFPEFVKNSKLSCVFATKNCDTTSSSFVAIPTKPFPPLFCDFNTSGGILFMYPPLVSIKSESSSGTNSSSPISLRGDLTTFVLLSLACLSFKVRSSSLTTPKIFFGLAKRSSRCAMSSFFSLSSSLIFFLSRPARACNFISNIALVCLSENLNFFIKLLKASSFESDFLIMAIISSMWSKAFFRPSKICARSLAFCKSYLARLVTTSLRWSMNFSSNPFSPNI